MSKKVLDLLQKKFGDGVLETSSNFGNDVAVVDVGQWHEMSAFLREDETCAMDHFIDLTAVDYPDRESGRFEVVLMLRSMKFNHRIIMKTSVDESLPTLSDVWPAADWAEREAFDMFGLNFESHPDLRRILLYPEFEGYPLRKDYPISRTQPLVEYRETTTNLAPFGADQGQPWTRREWEHDELHVSPAIGVQLGQRPMISEDPDAEALFEEGQA